MNRGHGNSPDVYADLQLEASPLGRALLPSLAQDEILRNPAALREVRDAIEEAFKRLCAGRYYGLACEFGQLGALLGFAEDRARERVR